MLLIIRAAVLRIDSDDDVASSVAIRARLISGRRVIVRDGFPSAGFVGVEQVGAGSVIGESGDKTEPSLSVTGIVIVQAIFLTLYGINCEYKKPTLSLIEEELALYVIFLHRGVGTHRTHGGSTD
jgi:hypothetical protein